ncbi:hypothetical protein EJ377_03520 [Chryseobacterium arthrosphaerae]|uniref:Uncharacterized protein n=1 Tax=Chryseobacterium arthrosphaerae TaxID=651561 RepID=A0A432DZB5_9FLAO|nr:hypothetical protein EJ377_03520 [Chryseobacterium arthrosphaerae]
MIKRFCFPIGYIDFRAVSLTVYWNLPIEITRHSDIEYGNKLVLNLEHYQKEHHSLPRYDDRNTLHQLGFKQNNPEQVRIMQRTVPALMNWSIWTVLTDLI